MDGHNPLDELTKQREETRIKAIDWAECVGREPPPFKWAVNHWLSMHPTLLAGRGGIGKSLLAQCLGTALATGQKYINAIDRSYVVGLYMCEDDRDEIERRQAAINQHLGVEWVDLDALHVAVREGLNNTLFEPEYGVLRFTSAFAALHEWVLDLGIEFLFLDNVSQCYAGPSADNGAVTRFVNGLRGIWREYRGAPILLAHPARAIGSEFSGAAAWENAVRMRWYLDDKPPDQNAEDGTEPDTGIRYLAKRKANYTERDLVRMTYLDGVLVPDEWNGKPFSAKYQADHAEQVVVAGVRKLIEMKQTPTDGNGTNYLPKLMLDFKLNDGLTKRALTDSMRSLMTVNRLERAIVGQYANRTPRYGLVPK